MIDALHPEILSKEQQKILEKSGFLKKANFYLAGGTGLALQLGHRTSIDLDFYTEKKIKKVVLAKEIESRFKKIQVVEISEDNLRVFIGKTSLTGFYYPYPLIRNYVKFLDVNLASVEDIASMKLIAIAQRGKKRDFIDVYYLLKQYSLSQLLTLAEERFSAFESGVILKGLCYYQDADNEKEDDRIQLSDKTLTWPKVKKILSTQVKNFCQTRGIKP